MVVCWILMGSVFAISTVFLVLTALISFLDHRAINPDLTNEATSRMVILTTLAAHFVLALLCLIRAKVLISRPSIDTAGSKKMHLIELVDSPKKKKDEMTEGLISE